tara:strand:+ start:102 stop:809 length:708 start_codon:yes stop_codon:yes gene_type:complete
LNYKFKLYLPAKLAFIEIELMSTMILSQPQMSVIQELEDYSAETTKSWEEEVKQEFIDKLKQNSQYFQKCGECGCRLSINTDIMCHTHMDTKKELTLCNSCYFDGKYYNTDSNEDNKDILEDMKKNKLKCVFLNHLTEDSKYMIQIDWYDCELGLEGSCYDLKDYEEALEELDTASIQGNFDTDEVVVNLEKWYGGSDSDSDEDSDSDSDGGYAVCVYTFTFYDRKINNCMNACI